MLTKLTAQIPSAPPPPPPDNPELVRYINRTTNTSKHNVHSQISYQLGPVCC